MENITRKKADKLRIERYKFVELLNSIHKRLNLRPNTISIVELSQGHYFKQGAFYKKVYFAVANKKDVTKLFTEVKNLEAVKSFETVNNANLALDKYKDKLRLVINY